MTKRLHHICSSALLLSLYPVVSFLMVYGGAASWQVIFALIGLPLLSELARLQECLMRRFRRRHAKIWFWLFCWLVGIGLGAVCFELTASWSEPFFRYVAVGWTVLLYQAAIRIQQRSWMELVNPYFYAAICTWTVVPGLLIGLRGGAPFGWIAIVVFLLVSLVFAVAYHAAGMERSLSRARDGVEQDAMPAFRYNIRLIGIAFGVVAIVAWLNRWIAAGLRFGIHWLLVGIERMLSWLLGLFPDTGTNETGAIPASDGMQEAAAQHTSFWAILILSSAVLLLAVVFIWNRTWILEGLQHAWQALVYQLRQWFHPGDWETQAARSGAYLDEVRSLPGKKQSSAKKKPNQNRKNWNRQYRRYRSLPQDAQRYRLGYALAVEQLSTAGVAVYPWESAEQILEQVQQIRPEQAAAWEQLTDGYNQVRYGLQQPDAQAFAALEQILQKRG